MTYDDWISVGAVAVGIVLGTVAGYLLTARRSPRNRREREQLAEARLHPGQYAAFLGLSAFLAVALVEDVAAALRGPKPGFVLVKYLFAAAIGLANYFALKRRPEADEPGAQAHLRG